MDEKIAAIKNKLCHYSTRELLGMISTKFIIFGNDGQDIAKNANILTKTELMSPQKQYEYLAGLLMSTDYCSDSITEQHEEADYIQLEKDIQDITLEYVEKFLSSAFENIKDKKKTQEIMAALDAFTNYFETGNLRYPEQIESLIRIIYSPFDEELEKKYSLCTEDLISFYYWIEQKHKNSLDDVRNSVIDIRNFLSSLNPNSSDVAAEYQKMVEYGKGEASQKLQGALNGMNAIKIKDILDAYGEEKGTVLIDLFTLDRCSRSFCYYNDDNPFTQKPLCRINNDTLFSVHPLFLLSAIFSFILSVLENPNNSYAEKFTKHKAKIVEDRFLELLKLIFGDQARYHQSVCEECGTKEHDILIEYNKFIIIAEVKASKVREPLFNPEKAYVRVRDHFKSELGIGGAYQQAIALKKYILQCEKDIILFKNKTEKFKIEDVHSKEIYPFVLTLNNFGGIAVNTSLLLEKDENEPYPWVCNLCDLENIVEINRYLLKNSNDFMNYVVWRINNHTKFLTSDELEILEEYYINPNIKKTKKVILFPPNLPSLIDKIYFEKRGIPYFYPSLDSITKNKVGRNKPCPCGSGKKFKNCCGKS